MSRSSELIPNSYQTPNFLVDKLLPHLSGPQAKVLMVLCRKTFGWHKREDVISFSQFRDEAGISRSSAIEAMKVFQSAGLVLRVSKGRADMNAWSLNLSVDADEVLERLMPGRKRPADVEKKLGPEAHQSNRRTSTKAGLVQQADHSWSSGRTRGGPTGGPTETHETQESQTPIAPTARFAGVDTLPGLELTAHQPARARDSSRTGERLDDLAEVWGYYRARLKRSAHLELTKQRRAMGEAGLKACRCMAKLSNSPDPDGAAVDLMKLAIDRLAESSWHNGANESGVKYLDWEVLFRGRNAPCPQKLTDYWLNDEKFPDRARGAA